MKGDNTGVIIILLFLLFLFVVLCTGGTYKYVEMEKANKKLRSKEPIYKDSPTERAVAKRSSVVTSSGRIKPPTNSERIQTSQRIQQDQEYKNRRQHRNDDRPEVSIVVEADCPNASSNTEVTVKPDVTSIRVNTEEPVDLARGNKGLDEVCEYSSQCRGDLVCTKPMIYRMENFYESQSSNLGGTKFVPLLTKGLRGMGCRDFVEYEDNLVALMTNGKIYIVGSKGESEISTNGIKFTDLAVASDTIFALSEEGVVYRLLMSTYNTGHWTWKVVPDLPKGIRSIEAPHDGSALCAVAKDYTYIWNGMVQQQIVTDGYRLFGNSLDKYALAQNAHSVTLMPSGRILDDISAVAISSENKVFVTPRNKRNVSRISHMKTFLDEPMIITESTCQPSETEPLIV